MIRRTTSMPKRALMSAAVAALVLSGCGSNEDEEAKTAISDYLMEQQSKDQMIDLEEKEADCISSGMVDGIGVEQLKEYGFLKEDGTVDEKAETPKMEHKDAETMVDSMFECTDVMATMQQEIASSMGQQSAETKKCFEDALTEDAVRGMLVATFEGDQKKAGEEFTGAMMKCAMGAQESP